MEYTKPNHLKISAVWVSQVEGETRRIKEKLQWATVESQTLVQRTQGRDAKFSFEAKNFFLLREKIFKKRPCCLGVRFF